MELPSFNPNQTLNKRQVGRPDKLTLIPREGSFSVMEGRLFYPEFIRCPSSAVDRIEGTLPLPRPLTLPMGKESISTSQRQGQAGDGRREKWGSALVGMRSAPWREK